MPETTNRQKFSDRTGRTAIQPAPPFPRLPRKFIERYEKDIQDELNRYCDQCDEWVKKYVQSQS